MRFRALWPGLLAAFVSIPVLAASQARTLTVSLKGADIEAVAGTFARMTEAELSIAPGVEGRFDLRVENVTWMTALDAACESVGCRWRLSGGVPRRLELSQAPEGPPPGRLTAPIAIDLEKAEIRDVLTAFGKIAGESIEIDPRLEGKVSIAFSDVSARTALRAVCESVGCTVEETPEGIRVRRAAVGDRPASLESPISMQLAGAAAADVFTSLGAVLDCEVIVGEGVAGEITLDATDTPVGDLLDRICTHIGCSWGLETSPEGTLRLVFLRSERRGTRSREGDEATPPDPSPASTPR